MGTGIILILLVGIVLLAGKSSFKHLKGEGGCCGGSATVKIKKQKISHEIGRKCIKIEGMTCKHCKCAIENSLNSLEGVSATVNLKKKEAHLILGKEIANEVLKDVIEDLGYQVVEMIDEV